MATDATLDKILEYFSDKCTRFDQDDFFDKCKNTYPVLDTQYEFIPPFNTLEELEEGNIIRYIKFIGSVISNPSIIMKIGYKSTDGNVQYINKKIVNKNKAYIEYFEVREYDEESKVIRIYPENYFFFRRTTDKNSKLINKFANIHPKIAETIKKTKDTKVPTTKKTYKNDGDFMDDVNEIIKKNKKKT